tara:strand:- start:4 stop:417 length:414 start_codon:yes stop_codon:yes gene_type:complete
MISWLVVKHSTQKVWLWCKHNWKVVALLVYTVILYMLFSKNAQNALDALIAAKESHKSEVDVLNNAHSEEIKKRDENLKKYQETVKLIEEKYKEENKKLTFIKKRKVKEIVEKHSEDPGKLAELVKETFGFEIVNHE